MNNYTKISKLFDFRSDFYRKESSWSQDSNLTKACIDILALPNNIQLKILDYGSGPGVFACELVDRGYIVDVADISSKMLEKCYFARKKYQLPNDNIDDLYDVIILRQVLHYIEKDSWESLIDKLLSYLKPDGIILFSQIVPHCKLDYKFWKKMVKVRRKYRKSYPTENEFLLLCERKMLPILKYHVSYTSQNLSDWIEKAPQQVKTSISEMFVTVPPSIRALWNIYVDNNGDINWTNRWVHVLFRNSIKKKSELQ